MNSAEKCFYMIDKKGLGLEVGAGFAPMAPKKDGFNTQTIDHASRDELREKYKHHGVNIDAIEDVDFVWRGERLDQLIGKQGIYDFIIASNVIEHIPDIVSFFRGCSSLLNKNGVISLVIPDKRFCFDFFRWPTSTGDILQAYVDQRKRHPPGTVFDHYSLAATRNGTICWSKDSPPGEILFHSGLEEAIAFWNLSRNSDQYMDIHNWRFTPSSFRLIIADLYALGLVDLVELCHFDTEGFEFHVTLGKGQPRASINRLDLARASLMEILEGLTGQGYHSDAPRSSGHREPFLNRATSSALMGSARVTPLRRRT